MRTVEIDMAQGGDTSVDPRVAPQGMIARVQNARIDREGRLVTRGGYTSLGTGVQHNVSATLVPRDLYNYDGQLIAAGNINASQTGIRMLAKYQPSGNAPWHVDTVTGVVGALDISGDVVDITPADNVQILTNELASQTANTLIADAAVTGNGLWACLVSSDATSTSILIYDTATGLPIYAQSLSESNGRVLSIGNIFYVFSQTGTTINVRTKNPALTGALSGATAVATGTSAAPCAYDVALFENATDYLIAFPTGTGYTWRRFNSANAQQTTQSVVSLANAPVAICGATGETVNVANIRTTNGVELRTFDPTTAALSVGPTNIDTLTLVYEWVSICRFSSTQVHVAFLSSTPTLVEANKVATTAAHALTGVTTHGNVRQASKVATVGGRVFSWQGLGLQTNRPYGLVVHGKAGLSTTNFLAATVFDGGSRTLFPAAVVFHKSNISISGTQCYTALVSFDPRNKAYRAALVTWELFSGKRRQSLVSGGQLYLAGGMLTQYDGRCSVDVGFETNPVLAVTSQIVTGSLTLLATYTYVAVYRAVAANGEVTQSGPSDPLIVTLTGSNQTINGTITFPYNSRQSGVPQAAGAMVFVDLYRTEGGGSIPRFLVTQQCVFADYGGAFGFTDSAADTVVQTGALLYTQGAEGDVSGRLPIGSAGPCGVLIESAGKLLLGRLPTVNEVRLSTEKRPGETASFVNDDIFFVASQDQVQALVSADNGRKVLFGRSNIRELIGEGPNAAGIGDISDPIETEDRVGIVDWRSLVKTEHGVFFQASASTNDPKLYLLPKAQSVAVYVSEGIRDVLELYPIVTSATRHDEEQLVTFTLQNTAGTDGRIVHLDLRTSGMGKRGWVGKWIIDRVPTLEAPPAPEIVEEQHLVFPNVLAGTVTVPVPGGKQSGDRLYAVVCVQGAANTISTPVGYTTTGSQASALGFVRILERLYTSITAAQERSFSFTLGLDSVVQVKIWVLRGAHAVQLAEATLVATGSGATHALGTLTPTWGAANNAWLSLAMSDLVFNPNFSSGGMISIPIWTTPPAGFSNYGFRTATEGIGNSSNDVASSFSQQTAASLSGLTWLSAASVSSVVVMIAVRPLALTGTPVRASVAYQNRLVVCSSTDVLLNSATATSDQGGTSIPLEFETCDIYPMGPNGFGRHLSVVLLFEKVASTGIGLYLSYDGGRNWEAMRRLSVDVATSGIGVGQTSRLQWVPRRRKVCGVRAKLVIGDPTASAALRLLRLTMVFDELIGPVRLQMQERGSRQT